MDSSSSPSIPTPDSSTATNSHSCRQKSDPAWAYVILAQSNDGKNLLICNFCQKVVKGGGISRMKMHLAGQSGNVARCKKVPNDVQYRMLANLGEFAQQKAERKMTSDERNPFRFSGESEVRNEGITINEGPSAPNKKKRPASRIGSYFPSTAAQGSQPSIKAALQSSEKLRLYNKKRLVIPLTLIVRKKLMLELLRRMLRAS